MTPATPNTPRKTGIMYRLMMGFIGLFDRWLQMSCRAFNGLVSNRLDRELTAPEKVRYHVHRAMCGICREQDKRQHQIRSLTKELAHNPKAFSGTRLSSDATKRLRKAVISAADRQN